MISLIDDCDVPRGIPAILQIVCKVIALKVLKTLGDMLGKGFRYIPGKYFS